MDISDLEVPLLAEHVRKLAEAEPNTVTACRYFDAETQRAMCIVGHAMALQGITMTEVGVIDENDDGSNGDGIGSLLDGIQRDEYPETVDWLNDVQYKQDSGWKWSKAVEWADNGGDGGDGQ